MSPGWDKFLQRGEEMPEGKEANVLKPKEFAILLIISTAVVGGAALLMRIFGMKEK